MVEEGGGQGSREERRDGRGRGRRRKKVETFKYHNQHQFTSFLIHNSKNYSICHLDLVHSSLIAITHRMISKAMSGMSQTISINVILSDGVY